MQLSSIFPLNAPPVLDQLIQLPQPQSAVVLANSFGSHFPMPALQSSKLKHLDEPRKKTARDVLTLFQIICALKITVHATFLCT